FLSASDDDTARLWEIASGRTVRAFRGHSRGATAVAFEDGWGMLTGDGEGVIRRWKVAAEIEPEQLALHPSAIVALHPSAHGEALVVGGAGTVRPLAPVIRPTSNQRPDPRHGDAAKVTTETLKPLALVSLGGTLANPLLAPDGRALYILDRTERRLL